jgi:hypothetical protein
MFARAAKSWDIDRVCSVAASVVPANSNDNQLNRSIGSTGRPGGQRLACHWSVSPVTGKPECHWQIERAAGRRQHSNAPACAKAQPKFRKVLASDRKF